MYIQALPAYLGEILLRESKHPFWLTPLPKFKPNGVGFTLTPRGKNSLATTIADVMSQFGYTGKYRNHELRVTCISGLAMAGFQKSAICDVTGHSKTSDGG